jgi:hypothetical protein
MKGQPEVAAAPVVTDTKVKEPEKKVEAIVPTERKKGRVINPEHDIDTSKSILDKIAADPNIINRSAADAGKPATPPPEAQITITPAPVVAALAPAPTATQKLPDPKELKAGQFILYKAGPGCESCGGAGYQGRIGIYEVLEVDEPISKMIVGRATSDDIQMAAIRGGMLTMQQDGFVKALMGKTTIEEILRVTRE